MAMKLTTIHALYTLTFVPPGAKERRYRRAPQGGGTFVGAPEARLDVTSAVTGAYLGYVTAAHVRDYGRLPDDVTDVAQRFVRMVAQCWDPRTGEDGLRSLWATLAPSGWAFADTSTDSEG